MDRLLIKRRKTNQQISILNQNNIKIHYDDGANNIVPTETNEQITNLDLDISMRR